MASSKNDYIVWIDTEMSGLDVAKDTILEIACVITDSNLNIQSEDFNVVVNQPDSVLGNMNEWCTVHHNKSGLVHDSQSSTISLMEAEQMLLNFLKKHIPEGTCPLAGNSIYVDRLFLYKLMPLVNRYLHYRIIDVSTITELARRWNPNVYKNLPEKTLQHRALSDIKESIQQLKYYKDNIFMTLPL